MQQWWTLNDKREVVLDARKGRESLTAKEWSKRYSVGYYLDDATEINTHFNRSAVYGRFFETRIDGLLRSFEEFSIFYYKTFDDAENGHRIFVERAKRLLNAYSSEYGPSQPAGMMLMTLAFTSKRQQALSQVPPPSTGEA